MNVALPQNGVSICIPSYRRPVLLRECVASVFANQLRPLEVIVSDHDFGRESQEALGSLVVPDGVTLRHVEGPEQRTQSANVNALLRLASYERLMIVHDDDLLTPGAIDRMADAWDETKGELDAVYGRQYISDAEGVVDVAMTDANNEYYCKNVGAGVQPSNIWAALVGQFPNDGMMVRKTLALQCGYPSEAEVGKIPVDFHFGVRYAMASTKPFVLLNDYTAIYRRSTDSILRTRRKFYDGQFGFEHLERLSGLTPLEEQGRALALNRFASSAVMGYLAAGKASRAAGVLRRHLFGLDKKWSVRLALIGLVSLEMVGLPVLRKAGIAGRPA